MKAPSNGFCYRCSHAEEELENVLIWLGDKPRTQVGGSDNQGFARSLGGAHVTTINRVSQRNKERHGETWEWRERKESEASRRDMRARETTPRASEQKPAQERGHRRDPERMR